jgi:hypothetical protein
MGFLLDIFKSLFTEWLLYWLPWAGGLLAAYLRGRGVNWLDPLLTGILAGSAIALVVVSIRLSNTIAQQTAKLVTPENIETLARDWAYGFGYEIKPYKADNNALFGFGVTLPNGGKVSIYRLKEIPNYLTIGTSQVLTKPEQEAYDKLSDVEQKRLVNDVATELIRYKVEYQNVGHPLRMFSVSRNLPITGELTEFEFISRLFEVNSARMLAARLVDQRLSGGTSTALPY